ncbi:hypothetical protein H632_c4555p0, partial [Helicosporidium sp. ATCC 50920]
LSLGRYQLCGPCYSAEAQGPGAARGLPPGIKLSELRRVQCPAVGSTADPVPAMESEFFDSRQSFLSLCQGNHYQFDAPRRAKHSSMMVLYHLHNPAAPAFSSSCNVCQAEIAVGEGYRCTVCADFDMCNACHARPASAHPHPLVPHVRQIDETQSRLTEQERQERTLAQQRALQMLVHASSCADCANPSCAQMKGLFSHAMGCANKPPAGNCRACWHMWALLNSHASHCTARDCPVPECLTIRERSRQRSQRREEQRRAAYRAML